MITPLLSSHRLKDLVVRTETTKLVTDLVDFDRVQSLLLMISHRRRYLAAKEAAFQEAQQNGRLPSLSFTPVYLYTCVHPGLPAIVVDDTPGTPPPTTRDITSPGQDFSHRMHAPESPSSHLGLSFHSPDLGLSGDSPSRSSLHRGRRVSDISMLSSDPGYKSS